MGLGPLFCWLTAVFGSKCPHQSSTISTPAPTTPAPWQPPPLILFPGLSDTKLYVRGCEVQYPSAAAGGANSNCPREIAERKIWLSDYLLNQTECELELLSLRYDSSSGSFQNIPGVQISHRLQGDRTPFGHSLSPIECTYTDSWPDLCKASTNAGLSESYMGRMANFLSANLSYEEGKSLFSAPYDWRYDQNSDVLDAFYDDLTALVEKAVRSTGKRAILLGHSMGNILINRFLQSKVSARWQKKYLASTVNVAPPLGGTVLMMRQLLSGDLWTFQNVTVSKERFAAFTRSLSYGANLLPFPNAFGSLPLLTVANGSVFSTKNMDQFLELVQSENLVPLFSKNQPVPQKYVPMHCAYGVSQNKTIRELFYANSTDSSPQIVYGPGDGSVNLESMRICQKWKDQGHQVSVTEFPELEHTEIIMSQKFYVYLENLIRIF